MEEKALIEHASGYLKLLYNGINPIDKSAVGENSILKEEKIKRCLDYCIGVFDRIGECDNIAHGDYRIYLKKYIKREPELLKRAEFIFGKLSVGVNPFTNKKTDKNDTVNSVRISKCFEYTAYILSHTTLEKAPFSAEESELEQAAYSDKEVFLYEFVNRVNGQIDGEIMRKIEEKLIISYLAKIQFINACNGSYSPTKMGSQLGLSVDPSGNIVLNKTMQRLIVRNLENITKQAEGT